MTSLLEAARDLFLGAGCCRCARPGRVLCVECRDALPAGGHLSWPTPSPPGLAPPWSSGEYADALRALVLGHKERRLLALTPVLGSLLAGVVRAAVPVDRTILLVPVPSRPAAVRARGHDATGQMVAAAVRELRATGLAATSASLLGLRAGVLDQAGLDADQRARNLQRSMWVPPDRLRRAARRLETVRVVVCDDVITTGATAREAQRALDEVGLTVSAVAAVAATRRRGGARDASAHRAVG